MLINFSINYKTLLLIMLMMENLGMKPHNLFMDCSHFLIEIIIFYNYIIYTYELIWNYWKFWFFLISILG